MTSSLKILGLTGSIGMGKSETAKMFRRLGVPVFDADREVHRLMARGGLAVAPVAAAFPGVFKDNAIDRQALGKQVFGNPDALRQLEAILHPLVAQARHRFLLAASQRRRPLVVLDIPLLFETHNDRLCDYTLVVTAPAFLQKQRVMARPGMTAEKFNAILAEQLPDLQKRRRADFIVTTGQGKRAALEQIRKIIAAIKQDR